MRETTYMNELDQAILQAELEVEDGAESILLDEAMEKLNQKYYGIDQESCCDIR